MLKVGDALSGVCIFESDFEPAGKSAEDGVFGDTHDVPCGDATSASVGTQRRVLWIRTDLVLEELLDIARRHWKRYEFSTRRAVTREGCLPSGETFSMRTEDDGGSDGDADMTSDVSKKEFAGVDEFKC